MYILLSHFCPHHVTIKLGLHKYKLLSTDMWLHQTEVHTFSTYLNGTNSYVQFILFTTLTSTRIRNHNLMWQSHNLSCRHAAPEQSLSSELSTLSSFRLTHTRFLFLSRGGQAARPLVLKTIAGNREACIYPSLGHTLHPPYVLVWYELVLLRELWFYINTFGGARNRSR